MSKKHGAVVAHINDRSLDLWASFKEVADRLGVPYSRALENAARLWLQETSDQVTEPVHIPLPEAYPTPVGPLVPPGDHQRTESIDNPWV